MSSGSILVEIHCTEGQKAELVLRIQRQKERIDAQQAAVGAFARQQGRYEEELAEKGRRALAASGHTPRSVFALRFSEKADEELAGRKIMAAQTALYDMEDKLRRELQWQTEQLFEMQRELQQKQDHLAALHAAYANARAQEEAAAAAAAAAAAGK